jgi:hypothetical protein
VARGNGYTRAVLWVLRDNQRGHAFYEALGWAPDGAERKETLTPYGLPEVRYSK